MSFNREKFDRKWKRATQAVLLTAQETKREPEYVVNELLLSFGFVDTQKPSPDGGTFYSHPDAKEPDGSPALFELAEAFALYVSNHPILEQLDTLNEELVKSKALSNTEKSESTGLAFNVTTNSAEAALSDFETDLEPPKKGTLLN